MSSDPKPPAELGSLHHRLKSAAGNRSYRQLADLTRTNHESVRRYMTGSPPSAEFLVSFCAVLGLNGDWLLTGRGPMLARELGDHVLSEAQPADLMSAVAHRLESLISRVEQLELFAQTSETRLRAELMTGVERRREELGRESDGGVSVVDTQARERVRRIADAITGRPPADAHRPARAGGS